MLGVVYHALWAVAPYLGLAFIASLVFDLVRFVFKYFVAPGKDLRGYGEWAVVTGATDGIGREIAIQLAEKKFKVVLISRNEQRLADTQREIVSRVSDAEVKVIAADLSAHVSSPGYAKIAKELAKLDVGILYNNAGMNYDYPEYLDQADAEILRKVTALNIDGLTEMTRLVLPGMVERKRGAIINVSSGAGCMTQPMQAVYSASKAYVNYFTRALNVEYQSKGVHVQLQLPYFVSTKMSKHPATVNCPAASDWARASLRWIGRGDEVVPHWAHALEHDLATRWMSRNYVGNAVLRLHEERKATALKSS